MLNKPTRYQLKLTVNGHKISDVLIGRHYTLKHGASINDELVLMLVTTLDGHRFPADSVTTGIEYFAADIFVEETGRVYRLIWLFEGKYLEVLGVVNVYRRKKKRK